MRKLLMVCLVPPTLAIAVVIALFCLVYIHYGDRTSDSDYTETAKTLVYGNGKPNKAVIIYPANMVSAKQYQDIATKLSSDALVIIVKSNFRMSAFPKVSYSEIKKAHPEIKTWVLVGHSAGAVQACRAESATVVTVNGYCKKPMSKPSLAIIGSEDTLFYKDIERNANQLKELPSGHFSITDTHKTDISHQQIIEAIKTAI